MPRDLTGVWFLDYLSGYHRQVLSTDDSGDNKYRISLPNDPFGYEIVHRDFIETCLMMAGAR